MTLSLDMLLEKGLSALDLPGPSEPFRLYLSLLEKWNQAYNLTAVRDPAEMVARHILDSLAVLPFLDGKRILDVGSGAGLPGIPLAIAQPERELTLLDSNGKKTRFLVEVKRQLDLKNVNIVQARVETFHPDTPFDTVISRAFSELIDFVQKTQHLINKTGRWVAMKGRYPDLELEKLVNLAGASQYDVHAYTVPGLDSDRCCVCINNFK